MATDATGTPTAKGIPKYDTANDAPSGLGFNAAMDAIDTILDDYVEAPASLVSGEAMVWNGTGWARSSVTRLNTVRPQDLTQDAAASGDVLTWNGTIWAPAAPAATSTVEVVHQSDPAFSQASSSAEQTAWTWNMPANTLEAGDLLEIILTYWALNNTGAAAAHRRRFKVDGTALEATYSESNLGANANYQMQLTRVFIQPDTTAASDVYMTHFRDGTNGSFLKDDAMAIDITGQRTLAFTLEMTTSSANHVMKLNNVTAIRYRAA